MAELPTGLVTFLFTDIEGSTALWEQEPAAMRAAVARHDALLGAGIEGHGGVVVKSRGEGDSFFAVFGRASDAAGTATALQRVLQAEAWPTDASLRVRMALHTGEAELRDGDYYGEAVNRCARLRAAAHGGQILLSEATAGLVREAYPEGVTVRELGEHRLRHLTRPERIFQLLAPGLPAEFPRLNTLDHRADSLRTGGELREMTVLFADLRGFTDLAEALGPEQAFFSLNEYLTAMSDVIYDHQGTIDKYLGDEIMAFWGAPARQDNHARLACRAAVGMIEELERLNARWRQAGRRPLAMTVGVSTGLMMVGKIGSPSRLDYTVLGDAVNLGLRLQALNKEYGTTVIVSAATLRQAGVGFRSRFLGRMEARGKHEPVEVFELITEPPPPGRETGRG
jgi:class 3 adenylate cyclase